MSLNKNSGFFIFLLLGTLIAAQGKPPHPLTTYEGLKSAIEEGQKFVLFDVRDMMYYREGHIPEARNLPLEGIIYRPPGLDKNATIVVYGRLRSESDRAKLILRSFGFRNVHDFGPIRNWKSELETSRRR